MTARIVLLVTSPRLPAGLLTAAAWDLVRAHPVYAPAETEQSDALRSAGVPITVLPPDPEALIAALASHDTIVWLAGPGGDQDFARQLGLRLAREPSLAELELAYGSWDPPGARLLDAVAVMDRLASPGGDPWKQQQTHETLAKYMLEEAYEAYDAIAEGDLESLREELGDVLLQVVLHARLAENLPEAERWTIDDVAAVLVEKMVRRNPHVFAGEEVNSIEEITENWERIKREEKSRDSVLDGIAMSQPALSLAAKILQRAARAGIVVTVPAELPHPAPPPAADAEPEPVPQPRAIPEAPPASGSAPAPGSAPASGSAAVPGSAAAVASAASGPALIAVQPSKSGMGTASGPSRDTASVGASVPLPFPSSVPLSLSLPSPSPSIGPGRPRAGGSAAVEGGSGAAEAELGALLLGIVAEAQAAGLDAEAALRRAALEFAERVRAAEHENVGPPE